MTAADVRLKQLTDRVRRIWPKAEVQLMVLKNGKVLDDTLSITIPGHADLTYEELWRLSNILHSTRIDLSHEAGEPNHRQAEVTPDLRPGQYVVTVKLGSGTK